jgi:glycosyltransferase involved in cell wall biosynthesis
MRILQVHNQYFSGRGGEDSVVEQERLLLLSYGHQLQQLLVQTSELRGASLWKLAKAAVSTTWSSRAYSLIRQAISEIQPEIVHVHNTFPLLSPGIFWATSAAKVPLVVTLHNYRYICANGVLSRDGKHCHDCVGKNPLPALLHKCYSGNLGISASIVSLQLAHRSLGTFRKKADAYIALSQFAKNVFCAGGFPGDRIFIKGNFLAGTQAAPPPFSCRSKRMVFVGTIDSTKGIDLLLHAWMAAELNDWQLVVIGQGREMERLQTEFPSPSIQWTGTLMNREVLEILRQSRFLVLPSRVYEGFPMSVVEAFGCGTPVIVPDHGPFPEIVNAFSDGFLLPKLTSETIRDILKAAACLEENPWRDMSLSAHLKACTKFGADTNHDALMTIYAAAAGRLCEDQSSDLQGQLDQPQNSYSASSH